jgi:hypothetical protein
MQCIGFIGMVENQGRAGEDGFVDSQVSESRPGAPGYEGQAIYKRRPICNRSNADRRKEAHLERLDREGGGLILGIRLGLCGDVLVSGMT